MITVGLRFEPGDERLLRNLAERARLQELGPMAVATFANAADACRDGEPLRVRCADPQEAVVMADGYVRFGVRRPAVEELSG